LKRPQSHTQAVWLEDEALMIGKTLGHYQITEKLGEGGMGVVYKARDTHLDRFAALKVLPPEKVSDPDRKRRFIQEAKAASALNHPSIITIYDIDQADGVDFIAMEYVAGKTLDELIPRRGMRLSLALKYAVQIADALARAHGVGIIHRDLKPSNVMVDEHGLVKVLDFGLAKLTEAAGPEAETAATRTGSGTVLGTAAYMSPEQAEGKRIDTRSDIFSFGSMLYEMLTGLRAFRGDTRASPIASILREEPKPISQVMEGLPRDAEKIVRRCLRKDPEYRIQTMADLRVALAELKEESDSGALESAGLGLGGTVVRGRRWWVGAVAGMAVTIVALGIAGWFWINPARQTPPDAPMIAKPLVTYPGDLRMPTFSPEGDRIAFSWNGEKQDNSDIYVRLIGPGEPQRLTTNPARDFNPAWSPDGKFIAFLRELQATPQFGVFVIPALGGTERRIAEIDRVWYSMSFWNLTWSPDNKWLVTADRQPYGLHLISVETGEKRRLTSPPKYGGDGGASFSPDGHSLAFARMLDLGLGDVYRISLTDDYEPKGEPERLTYENRDIASPVWTRDGSQILYSSGNWWTSGRVVRRIALSGPKGSSGYPTVQESFGEDAWELAISATSRRLVYHRGYSDSNIYRIELRGKDGRVGAPERLIASTRVEKIPEYSPDGKTIAFTSTRSGSQEIWLCNADGSNQRQLTFMGGPLVSCSRWSPDGKTLVFDSRKEGSSDLYLISSEGGSPRRLTSDPGYEGQPRWSGDGKWIYFKSDRSERAEVYRMPAGGGEAVQVTGQGGHYAFESPDGKWLYYSKEMPGGFAIWKVPVGGGEEDRFNPGPIGGQEFNFVVVDDGIFFTKDAKAGGTLEFIDFKSGKTRTICQVEKRWGLGIAISPDRRWILCTLDEEGLNDLMLVENFR
jgi:Tol biopolymer transport system component/predicted Ser/Thr protein kinase